VSRVGGGTRPKHPTWRDSVAYGLAVDQSRFVDELNRAFAAHQAAPDGRGAVVLEVRLLPSETDDFGVAVTYRNSRTGRIADDVIPSVRDAMAAYGVEGADDLAAFWRIDLDEQVLAAPPLIEG
jgi:hypothetical protein